jgi:hypothetical protein
MAAPRASSGVHSDEGFEGGRDLHPVVGRIGAAQASRAKRRLENRIRISGLIIQPGTAWGGAVVKSCVAGHGEWLPRFRGLGWKPTLATKTKASRGWGTRNSLLGHPKSGGEG